MDVLQWKPICKHAAIIIQGDKPLRSYKSQSKRHKPVIMVQTYVLHFSSKQNSLD